MEVVNVYVVRDFVRIEIRCEILVIVIVNVYDLIVFVEWFMIFKFVIVLSEVGYLKRSVD